MDNPLFLPAVMLTVYVGYKLFKRNSFFRSGTVGKDHHKQKKQVEVIRQFTEPSDAQIDPMNMTSNKKHNILIKSERGPNGVPRNIYMGAGGGEIPLYGHNYHIL
jgi:hypothetical protein